jgi:hypothetical protein
MNGRGRIKGIKESEETKGREGIKESKGTGETKGIEEIKDKRDKIVLIPLS